MGRLLTISIIIFTNLSVAGQLKSNESVFKKTLVSKDWIQQILSYNHKSNSSKLLKEFEKYLALNKLELSIDSNESKEEGFINPMSINLDDDIQEEILALVGWTEYDPVLAVFKQQDDEWFLIFCEAFHVYYSSPELNVANVPSKNKTFYIRWLYERGSGIYRDSYHFYKLINGKVYHCLEIVNRAKIFGWGLYLNQQIQSTFKFNSLTQDELWVTYDYNFFPGAVYQTDAPWEAHTDIPFVKDMKGISYRWDASSNSYKPNFYKGKDDLNEAKIACFGDFGNDSLFVKAYAFEINQLLEKGTDEQKSLLKKYLELSKTASKVVAPTGELEEKGNTGNLKYYGIKKNK